MSRRHARHSPRPRLTVLAPGQPAPAPAPIVGVADLAERIAAGHLDEELRELAPVIIQRLRLLSSADRVAALASFNVGDRVRINHTVRPLYLHEACGTVEGWLGQQVLVYLDHPIGRYMNRKVRCAPQALERLSSE
jgi:hypothetical protein